MRFAAAHKTATYLAVGCAFLALVLSGELGAITVGLATVGLVASWWWEPARHAAGRWLAAWTAASVAVFAWAVLQLLLGGDVLLLGAEFLLYLQVAKLWNRRELKDYLQIYVLSFLMLTAGTVLNSELTYGVCFLGSVVTASWALMAYHLRREIEERYVVPPPAGAAAAAASPIAASLARALESRALVDRRFFAGSALVSLGVFASAVALFLLIPRIGFGLFIAKDRSGVTMAGFSDGVQLGGHGMIRTDDTVVMRVQIERGPTGRDAPARHWRGVAFDQYTEHGEWRRSHRAPETRRKQTTAGKSVTHHLLYAGPPLDQAALEARAAGGVRQQIYLEPLGYDVLFGAAMPLAFTFESSDLPLRERDRARGGRNDEMRRAHGSGIRYQVVSDPVAPPAARLRAAPDTLPPGFAVYTEVPARISARTREAALAVTASATSDYDRMVALERWLKQGMTYSLEQVAPPTGQEPLDFFLFDRRMGHCEYFASALAVMGRIAGVPTRSVNGFLGGEWNEYDEYIAVRAGDAHSWVEAYFPGQGWVTFDPTPAAESTGLGRGGDGPLDRLHRMADTLRFKWFKWVIEYDLARQLALFKRLGGLLRGGASSLMRDQTGAVKAWASEHRAAGAAIAGALGLIAGAAALRRARRRAKGGRAPGRERRAPPHPATQTYLRVVRRLGRRGRGRPAAATPREHARALLAGGVPGAAELAELCEIHYAAEYGASDPALARRARDLEAAIAAADAADRRARRRWRRGRPA